MKLPKRPGRSIPNKEAIREDGKTVPKEKNRWKMAS